MSLQCSPYIFFKGNCREAMEFYKDVFGGELNLQTYQDTGQESMGGKMGGEKIMHASLNSDTINLYGSDTESASDKAAKISLSLMGEDEEKLRGIFDKLKEGGSVFSELKKEFWGDTFGSLTDKFGIDWMVDIQQHA